MDFLLHVPSFVKVGVSFLGILAAYRLGLGLGWAILLSASVLTLWTGAGLAGAAYQLGMLRSPENNLLLVVILLLLFFTEALDKTGRMRRTIDALEAWLKSPRLLLAGFPALVGLLPMPGGALFSAPLVAAVDGENSLPSAHKAAINYWFRHIWEYWWPLYPGIILAIKYAGISSGLFFLIQMPYTVVAAGAGYLLIMRNAGRRGGGGPERGKLDITAALSALWPIGILVAMSLAGSFVLPVTGMGRTLANIAGMVAGLAVGLVAVFAGNGRALASAAAMFAKRNTWDMMLLVLGILVFSAALTCPLPGGTGATLVTGMRDEFISTGIPIILVIALIPFISGAVTGVAFGFVGASFPIVFALLGASPPLHVACAATVFAYGCGYVGMILSPVHICFVVTNEYFKSRMFDTYRYIFAPSMVVLASCLIMAGTYFYLLK
jgi:uncharacterized protein